LKKAISGLICGLAALAAIPSQATESAIAVSERKAILKALRGPTEKSLGAPVIFVVTTLRANPGYAFVQAEPQRPGGGRIDGRALYGEDWDNMDGLTTTAILRKSGRGWTIVERRVGATDAWYCGYVPVKRFDPCGGYPPGE
jgi:hypothetical protein